jgi:hypothetical protein
MSTSPSVRNVIGAASTRQISMKFSFVGDFYEHLLRNADFFIGHKNLSLYVKM